MVDTQLLVNIGMTVFNVLLLWLTTSLRSSISDRKDFEKETNMRIEELRLVVVGEYMKKADINQLISALFKKLDRMEEKIDKKADKHES